MYEYLVEEVPIYIRLVLEREDIHLPCIIKTKLNVKDPVQIVCFRKISLSIYVHILEHIDQVGNITFPK